MSNGRRKATSRDPNPERGLRGDFLEITITIPAKMFDDLKALGFQRRIDGQKNTDISNLLREAAVNLLRKKA